MPVFEARGIFSKPVLKPVSIVSRQKNFSAGKMLMTLVAAEEKGRGVPCCFREKERRIEWDTPGSLAEASAEAAGRRSMLPQDLADIRPGAE